MIFTILEAVETSSLSLPLQVTVYSGALIIILVIWKSIKFYRNNHNNSNGGSLSLDTRSSHIWHHIDILSHSAYCNVCEGIIVDGVFCDSCGICADSSCHAMANSKIPCKSLSVIPARMNTRSSSNLNLTNVNQTPSINGTRLSFKHHWIRGNVPVHSTCTVCSEECGDQGALMDYRCCWCQRISHEDESCYDLISDQNCDLGKWKLMIVPPYGLRVKKIWSKGRRQIVIDSLSSDTFEPSDEWTPLVVIANKTSGDNEGDKILRAFRSILNPAQVIDLNESPAEHGLEWIKNLSKNPKFKDVKIKVLVAGGDGTIGWVLNIVDKMKLDHPKPAVGILPLGTGNDLSRVLGWGESFSCDLPVDDVMFRILKAKPVRMDRWKVRVTPGRLIPIPPKEVFMNNYFSVGVDALVALNFHETRESKFYKWLGNRLVNKFLYLTYGTTDFLQGRKCSQLNERISLEMDGKLIDLPELESIVVLNIASWGAGANLWDLGLDQNRMSSDSSQPWPRQKMNDRLVEVVGLYSSFHIGQLMIGLSEPLRLGQAKVVKIQLKDRLPIQVDGEPWLNYPSTVSITYHSEALMLTTRNPQELT